MLRPTGTQILIKAKKHENITSGGIIRVVDEVTREQKAESIGIIVAFGPCCYVGWKGCEDPDIPPYKQWGIDIGDTVEHRKYNAMDSNTNVEDEDVFRYIQDIDILGVIIDE